MEIAKGHGMAWGGGRVGDTQGPSGTTRRDVAALYHLGWENVIPA